MSADNKILLVSSDSSTKSTTWQMEKIHAWGIAFREDDLRHVLKAQSRMPRHRSHSDLEESGVERVISQVETRSCVSQAMMLTCFPLRTVYGLSTPHQAVSKDATFLTNA